MYTCPLKSCFGLLFFLNAGIRVNAGLTNATFIQAGFTLLGGVDAHLLMSIILRINVCCVEAVHSFE